MVNQPAGVALRAWLERSGVPQTDLAKTLRVSKTHLSRLISGERTPSLRVALQIHEMSGIPVTSWEPVNLRVSA